MSNEKLERKLVKNFDDLENGEQIEIENVPQNKSVTVNGKHFDGDGIVIRKWLLRGVATCLYGADSQTATQTLKDDKRPAVPSQPSPCSPAVARREFIDELRQALDA